MNKITRAALNGKSNNVLSKIIKRRAAEIKDARARKVKAPYIQAARKVLHREMRHINVPESFIELTAQRAMGKKSSLGDRAHETGIRRIRELARAIRKDQRNAKR